MSEHEQYRRLRAISKEQFKESRKARKDADAILGAKFPLSKAMDEIGNALFLTGLILLLAVAVWLNFDMPVTPTPEFSLVFAASLAMLIVGYTAWGIRIGYHVKMLEGEA
jgi:hypothetical protein